jgi:hypothetical protein
MMCDVLPLTVHWIHSERFRPSVKNCNYNTNKAHVGCANLLCPFENNIYSSPTLFNQKALSNSCMAPSRRPDTHRPPHYQHNVTAVSTTYSKYHGATPVHISSRRNPSNAYSADRQYTKCLYPALINAVRIRTIERHERAAC